MPDLSPQGKSAPRRGERLFSYALNLLLVISLAALGIVAWVRLPGWLAWVNSRSTQAAPAESAPANTEAITVKGVAAEAEEISLSSLMIQNDPGVIGVSRKVMLDTIIPTRPRTNVITYTVQTGDSLFSIADQYGLEPETILWGNFEILEDNPHLLSTGQVLNILPTNGTYYQWHSGDNLASVASFFGVDVNEILNYPGNQLDLTATDPISPGITADSWLIIPGGKRALKDWGPPAISRSNPASARYYGDGYCGSIYEGAVGTGTFIWPTTDRSISGYGYSGIHTAIDIAGATGNSVFAADSGVVVFSGWSNYGYGYMVVIDHGNGWQTAYAHLSAISAGCGQSVFQAGYIGALGSTGNSTGPHLHFEMVYNGTKPNPLDYIQ